MTDLDKTESTRMTWRRTGQEQNPRFARRKMASSQATIGFPT